MSIESSITRASIDMDVGKNNFHFS